MHEKTLLVTYLAIYLSGEQPIYFNADASEEEVHNYIANTYLTLIAFFRYNIDYTDR